MRARESAQRLARGAGKVSTRPGGRFAQPLSAGRRGTVEGLVGRLGFEIQVMQLAVAGTGVQPVRRLDQHLADRGFRTGPRGLEAARRPAPAGPCSAASTRARTCTRLSSRPATSPTSPSTARASGAARRLSDYVSRADTDILENRRLPAPAPALATYGKATPAERWTRPSW